MRPRAVTVQARDAQEAASKAAKELGVPTDELEVKDLGEGRFKSSLLNCDAEIELEISPDNLTATIVAGAPAKGTGKPLDGPQLMEILRNFNVRVPPDTEVAKKVLKTLAKGYEISNVVIAQGIPPEPAKDARVSPLGDWQFPVFPNDAFGRLEAATIAKPGKSLTGETITPQGPDRGRSMNFLEHGGCYFDQSSFTVRSDRFGLVVQNNLDMFVKNEGMLDISKDQMEVRAAIYPKDFRGERFSVERIASVLEAEDISGSIDTKAITKAIEQAVKKGTPVKDVLVCRGSPPKDGEDGWFEMLFEDDRPHTGTMDASTGRVDFRARGVVRSVKKGELLGKLHPPKQGVPGRDVFNKVIPAREGKSFDLQVSGYVESDPESHTFQASDDGMVFFVGNNLSVTDVFTTKGDVNMSCGNIEIEKGSVHVCGSILSGFSVISPGNILVDEVVENARVHAEGDIEVRGGILMDPSEGKIAAKGGISALYAKNATISAGGDVNIAHEVNNCIVFAGNKVIATKGRGKIIGSTVRAGKGVEANEIGSDLGVETTIFLGIERRSFSEDLAKKRKLQEVLQRIYGSLGTADPRTILQNAPEAKRPAIASLLKARLRAEKQIKEIEAQQEQERERLRKAATARVRVHKTIYPGTVVNCFGVTLRISEQVSHSQVLYDPAEQKVVIASL